MSTIKLICPKCNHTEFKGKLTQEAVVSFIMDEEGNVREQVESVDNSTSEFKIATCGNCNAKVSAKTLVQGMQSDISGKWYPVELLCQTEMEDEEGNVRTVILTQEEYEKLNAPSIDEMDEAQLREVAKSQVETISTLQQQMAEMMAKMEQLMNQSASAPKETSKPKAEKPAVETNIKAPEEAPQETPEESVIYSDDENGETFIFDGDNNDDESIDGIDSLPGFEAPF